MDLAESDDFLQHVRRQQLVLADPINRRREGQQRYRDTREKQRSAPERRRRPGASASWWVQG